MTVQFCIPVEYRYRREHLPKSRRWHLDCYKTTEYPVNESPGLLDLADAGGEQVSIFIAVPCDEQGQVDADTQEIYEDIADQKFREVRPDAELA